MALKIIRTIILFSLILHRMNIVGQQCLGYDSLRIKIDKRYNDHLDSVQIIIKRLHAFNWWREIIVFYKDNSGIWHGEMSVTKTKRKNGIFYDINSCYILLPKKDWTSAIQKYYDLKFDTLPNMKDIEDENFRIIHGIQNIFTYRKNTKSRSVIYDSPELFKRRAWQTANAAKILKIHKKYFIRKKK